MLRRLFWPVCLSLFFVTPLLLVANDVPKSGEPGLFWLVSNFMMVAALLLASSQNVLWRIILTGIGTIFVLTNVALTISFATQGVAFNSAFFAHLDYSTFHIAIRTDLLRVVILFVYIILTPIFIFISISKSKPSKDFSLRMAIAVTLVIFSAWASYPIKSYNDFIETTNQSSERLNSEILSFQQSIRDNDTIHTPDARNLVIIYAESLEQTYFNENTFPGLLPNIKGLISEGVSFRDVEQLPSTHWTMAALVASQCGVPMSGYQNSVFEDTPNPFSKVTCLADYLSQSGYMNVFINSASLSYANKGAFLRDHGYELTLGVDELPSSVAHGWGMYDVTLFAHAKSLFDALADGSKPFNLTILTLDTHFPRGTPSPGCAAYVGHNSVMLDAVHCADKLISDFIGHVRRSPVAQNTVIALVSDHLLMPSDISPMLDQQERSLLFLLLDPSLPVTQHKGPSSHFDIAPTLLDAAGVQGHKFAFGQSLLRHSIGKAQQRGLTNADIQGFRIENLFPE